jgi:hypothetical protein
MLAQCLVREITVGAFNFVNEATSGLSVRNHDSRFGSRRLSNFHAPTMPNSLSLPRGKDRLFRVRILQVQVTLPANLLVRISRRIGVKTRPAGLAIGIAAGVDIHPA